MKNNHKKVYLENLNGTYQFIDESRLFINRELFPLEPFAHQEVVGSAWFLVKITEANIQIKCRTKEGKKTLDNDMLIYAPAFSLLEFYVSKGHFKIEILASKIECYENVPTFPCVFKTENKQSLIELSDNLKNGEIINPLFSLEYNEEISALALKTKDYFDKFYGRPIEISEVAQKYKTSQAVVARYFKKAYHLTPTQYLSELRAKETVALIMGDKKSVMDASVLLGFNEQRQLCNNFKKIFKSIPSQLQK